MSRMQSRKSKKKSFNVRRNKGQKEVTCGICTQQNPEQQYSTGKNGF